MTTRAEMLRRHDLAEEARKRVRSGQYNQPQEVEPYQNPRAAALAAYKPPESEQAPSAQYELDPIKRGAESKQLFEPKTIPGMIKIPQMNYQTNTTTDKKAAADFITAGKATRDAQDPKNPILRAIKNNTVDLLGEGIDRALVNTGLGRVANRFSQSAGNAVGVDTQAAGAAPLLSTGSKIVDKTADIAGALGGMAVNPAALEQGLIQGGYGVANRLTSRLSEGLGKRAATGAIAGAIQNSALSGVQGKTTAKDIGIAAAEGAVLGGVGDPLLHGLGSAAGKLLKRNVVPAAETQAKEVSQAEKAAVAEVPPTNAATPELAAAPNTIENQVADYVRANPTATINELQGKFKLGYTTLQKIKESAETAPMSTRAQALAKHDATQAQTAASATTFKTSKGSTYTVDANGSTTRTKTKHEGHDPNDVGLKDPSERTVYVDKDLASNIGMHGNLNSASKPRIVIRDDGMYLVSLNSKTGKWGRHGEKITYTTTPEIGKSPIEFWGIRNEDGLGVVPSKFHAGNEITEMGNSSTTASPSMKQRGLVGNLERSGKVDDATMNAFKQNPEANYEPIRNADTVAAANARVSKDTLESEKGYIMNKGGKGDYLSTEDIATGFRLLDEYKALGDVESASQIALKLAQTGTRNGQAVQINAIYSRLTPQGVLRVASKVFNEGVDDIAKQKPLPPELTQQITDAAEAMQKASGSESLSKAAITIFEKARSGQALDEKEIATLKRFANEAKKLLPAEKAPRAPRAPREPNTRAVDKVKAASSSAAEKARARIAARRNRLSANPLDEWADYAIVGFDHMMTGAVKIADFSSKMRQEFGDGIDSVMDKIYVNAYGKYRRANKIPASQFETMTNKALAGEKISQADADSLRVMAIELSQLEGAAKNEAAADLQEAFNAMKNGTPGKKAASVLRSVQLGNARTILRNEISNNAFYMLDTVRRKFIATPFDLVASSITGKNREIFWKNGPQAWNQYFKDWGTGYKMGKRGLNPGGLQSQYDLGSLAFNPKSTNVIDKVGSFMERNVGAFMKAGDYAAANRAISNEMGQLAQAKAYSEGLRGKELARKAEEYFHTADSKMAEQAQKYGEYMTFQDKNFLSDAAVNLRDKVLNFNQDFGLGNVVINYPKTPANILMRAVDYSPLGFVKFMGQIGRAAVKKDVTKKEFIDTFTRALAGTGIAGIGLYLSKLGMLNVLPSKDIGVSELERKAGKIPNSLNITALKRYVMSFGDEAAAKPKQGDTYASVDWFQPLAIPASVGAAAGQSGSATRLNTGINAADAGMQSLDAALESFGNMSVYRNIKDLVGNSYSTPSQKAGKLAANAATMFTPALLGQVRNVVDPNTRDTGTKSGFVGQVKGQLMNRIPGLSSKLPKSVDTFGDEKKSDYGIGTRALNAFLNPSLVDQYTPTPEAKAVLDLIERTGEKTLAPNKPQRSMTYKKQTYGFTQDQYREYQKLTGKFVTENLRKSQSYLDNPAKTDAQRIKKVSDEITDAGDKARKEMRKKMGIK